MTITTRTLIPALVLIAFASSSLAQDRNIPSRNYEFVVTMKDSAGRVYTRSVERPLLDINVPFDTLRVKRNWSKIKKGLSQSRVEQLLGRSRAVEHDPQHALVYWWYGRRAVVFNSITKKVSYRD